MLEIQLQLGVLGVSENTLPNSTINSSRMRILKPKNLEGSDFQNIFSFGFYIDDLTKLQQLFCYKGQ